MARDAQAARLRRGGLAIHRHPGAGQLLLGIDGGGASDGDGDLRAAIVLRHADGVAAARERAVGDERGGEILRRTEAHGVGDGDLARAAIEHQLACELFQLGHVVSAAQIEQHAVAQRRWFVRQHAGAELRAGALHLPGHQRHRLAEAVRDVVLVAFLRVVRVAVVAFAARIAQQRHAVDGDDDAAGIVCGCAGRRCGGRGWRR